MSHPKLKDGAVPCILPNCPSYLSSPVIARESPDQKRERHEETSLQKALAESLIDDVRHRKAREFSNVAELRGKLDFVDATYWSVVDQTDSLSICRVVQSPHPIISRSVVIKPDCAIHTYVNDVEVPRLGNYKIPDKISDTNDLDLLLGNLRKTDVREYQTKTAKPCMAATIIHLVLSFLTLLKDETFDHFHTLNFVCEQLKLMTLKKPEYSTELLVFSSLFYNCSRPGYRLLRENNFFILPSYSTIRRIFLNKTFAPDAEQRSSNFLMYIKNKYKTLVSTDKVVTLMVDEIHIVLF